MPRATLEANSSTLTHDITESTRGSLRGIKFASPKDYQAFKRWLGVLAKRRTHLRNPTIPINSTKLIGLSEKVSRATFPWKIEQYPGKAAMLAWIMGVKQSSAEAFLYSGVKPSPLAEDRAVSWLKGKIAELQELVFELEKDAKEQRLKPSIRWDQAGARKASAKGLVVRRTKKAEAG